MYCALDIEKWSEVVQVATHFNEMLMSTRATVLGIMPAVVGAAALFVTQASEHHPRFLGIRFGAWIALGGLLILVAMFLLDYFYYYQLLLGSVEVAASLEKACPDIPPLTTKLISVVSEKAAHNYIYILYFVVAFLLLSLGIAIQFTRFEANSRTKIE